MIAYLGLAEKWHSIKMREVETLGRS